MKRVLLAALAGALLLTQGSVRVGAQAPGPLSFFTNYFITGDYAVGGTSLWRKGQGGTATADIQVNGVPPGVDIVGAFLYVQTAERVQWSGVDHATFNSADLGQALPTASDPAGGGQSLFKALNWQQNTRPCWSVAIPGGRRLVTYRADVLRFLPLVQDADSSGFNKFDLSKPLRVTVPDWGGAFGDDDELAVENPSITGARAVGASLVIVYRDPTMPYRGIVIYDGGYTKSAFDSVVMNLAGYYQPTAAPNARLTAVVGDGRPYLSERVRFNGSLVATNPFKSANGDKWDNWTYPTQGQTPLSVPAPANPANAYSVLEVSPNGLLSDCVSFSAVVLSMNVQDSDGDGLVDMWERAGFDGPDVPDHTGKPLPRLGAMGARVGIRDLFIEIGAMQTLGSTNYGTGAELKNKPIHSHLPGPEALKLMGEAFLGSSGFPGIQVHFDVGAGFPTGTPAEPFIVRNDARGGELIDEQVTVCQRLPTDPPYVCQFSDYPGTAGWKSGFRFLRDEVTAVNGLPVPAGYDETLCGTTGNDCTRRFDPNRQQMFHYALFAHAVGLPKEENPAHPEFHVPRTNTGIGDFPGGDVMVTLGAFDDKDGKPVGTPFMQASTLMHETGHNLERRHGGGAFEPNCKPTYFSVMNYLYQLRGLLDNDGNPHLDFSRGVFGQPLDEDGLGYFTEQPPYRAGWFVPLATSRIHGTTTPAKSFCNGADFGSPAPVVSVRVDAPADTPASGMNIDWDGDGNPATTISQALDVNFNGRIDGGPAVPPAAAFPPLASANDWANIRLNQIGARRNVGGAFVLPSLLDFIGPLSVNLGKGDLGKGDLGKGDLGKGDLGKGDLGKGDLGKGDLGKGDLGKGDLGKGDLGKGDLGGGDLFDGDPNNPGGELDFELFTSLGGGTPAFDFEACVVGQGDCTVPPDLQVNPNDIVLTWTALGGGVLNYTAYRVEGDDLDGPQVALGPPTTNTYLKDPAGPSLAGQYTYYVVANYPGAVGTPSNAVTITAVDDAPVAAGQTVSTDEDTAKAIVLGGSDPESRPLTFAVVTGPAHGTLAQTGTGPNVTYTPHANYSGPDSFTFKVNDGVTDSAPATVSITVNPVNDAPVANPQMVSTSEDTAVGIVLTGSDPEGGALTFVVTSPSNGVLGGTAPNFVYTPNANFHGSDSFTFKVNDGGVDSAPATVGITVNPVNDVPVANNDSYSTFQGVVLNVPAKGVLTNDTDADSVPPVLTAVSLTQPAYGKGTVVLNTNGSFTYTPPSSSFTGTATFTYKANDGTVSSAAATVTIAVTTAPYGFNNVQYLPPPAGKTFKPSSYGTPVEFRWNFTQNGVIVASQDAQPSVTIRFPNGTSQTFTPANCGQFGFSFTYYSTLKKWEFVWKPKNAAVGIYDVYVSSGKTNQTFPGPVTGPGFKVEFKN